MKHLETTLPSASTAQAVSTGRPTHVRWVFPRDQAMALSSRSVVGRDDSAEMVLSGTEVSRRHAEFRIEGPVVAIRDLDSRNGVFVDGVRCRDSRLEVGTVVRCGEWVGALISCRPEGGEDPLFFGEVAPGIFGGTKLRKALEPARKFVSDVPIIIQGKTGTGKEGTAAAVHLWSGRPGALVAVNCAAMPESLADAQLFGHVKGAFSGAEKAKQGLFQEANGRSLFLDEVLELPATVQSKLLRVIGERVVRPLGDSHDVPVDVRMIVAAQEPLEDAVAKGRFRADLFARLNGLTLVLPSLCDRREDIVPLFLHFLRQSQRASALRIDARLAEALCVYDWPLNVRELLLLATRLVHLYGPEGVLGKTHLPASMLLRTAADSTSSPLEGPPVSPDVSGPIASRARKPTDDDNEFQRLVAALHAHGTVAKAAEEIGISRPRAYRLISAHPEFSLKDKSR